MRDEQAFRRLMIQVRAQAKRQNDCISREKVRQMFAQMELTIEELMLVCHYLEEEKVTVLEDEAAYESLVQETLKEQKNKKPSVKKGSSAYLDMYLEDLAELEEVSKEERLLRIAKVLENRETANEVLPVLYLREVVDVARLYEGQGVAIEDLIGEGNIAVLTGAKILECCETPEEVETFLMKMIMDAMEALIMESSTDEELDLQVLSRVNQLNEKAKELAEALEREVTLEELAAELETDIEELKETLKLSGDAIPYIKHNDEEHDHEEHDHEHEHDHLE